MLLFNFMCCSFLFQAFLLAICTIRAVKDVDLWLDEVEKQLSGEDLGKVNTKRNLFSVS